MRIPLASSGLRSQDIEAAISVLKSMNLTMGAQVEAFESKMASYLDVNHFVMVNSGSSANLAIFEALLRPSLGDPILRPGDGVLVPAVAWPTTIWPLIQLGLRPVFVDVNLENISIDLNSASAILSKDRNIKAMFPIHPLGFGIEHTELDEFCQSHGLHLLSDVCESLGSWNNNKHAGTTSLASSFSFYFSHHITTMEGGGIATNSSQIADDLRSIRSHGWSRDRADAQYWTDFSTEKLIAQTISANQLKFQFVSTGFNLRPMEIQAAIGIEQLKSLDEFVIKRRSIAKRVSDALEGSIFRVVDGGTLNNPMRTNQHSWMLLPIRVEGLLSNHKRRYLDQLLELYEIESRPVLTGNFLRQPVMSRLKGMPSPTDFPAAEMVSSNFFMVSSHHDLSDSQVAYLCSKLNEIAIALETSEL